MKRQPYREPVPEALCATLHGGILRQQIKRHVSQEGALAGPRVTNQEVAIPDRKPRFRTAAQPGEAMREVSSAARRTFRRRVWRSPQTCHVGRGGASAIP